MSTRILKKYDFASFEEYYQYIVDSYVNGNITQTRDFFKVLKKKQRKEFLGWLLLDIISEDQVTIDVMKICLEYIYD